MDDGRSFGVYAIRLAVSGAVAAVRSRFTIALPTGWRAEGVTLNHAKVEPAITGSAYTWELRDLPYIEEEPASPEVTTIAPRLAVSYFPPPERKAGIGKTFNDWREVSRWLTELSDSQARSLVVRAATISVSDYPKVRAFYERIRAAEQSPVVLAKK